MTTYVPTEQITTRLGLSENTPQKVLRILMTVKLSPLTVVPGIEYEEDNARLCTWIPMLSDNRRIVGKEEIAQNLHYDADAARAFGQACRASDGDAVIINELLSDMVTLYGATLTSITALSAEFIAGKCQELVGLTAMYPTLWPKHNGYDYGERVWLPEHMTESLVIFYQHTPEALMKAANLLNRTLTK